MRLRPSVIILFLFSLDCQKIANAGDVVLKFSKVECLRTPNTNISKIHECEIVHGDNDIDYINHNVVYARSFPKIPMFVRFLVDMKGRVDSYFSVRFDYCVNNKQTSRLGKIILERIESALTNPVTCPIRPDINYKTVNFTIPLDMLPSYVPSLQWIYVQETYFLESEPPLLFKVYGSVRNKKSRFQMG